MLNSKYLNEHSIPAIIAIIFCILLYLDSNINTVRRTGRDYVKAFIVIYCLSYLALYLFNPSHVGGGNPKYSSLREEIFIGHPNF